jgi:ABC-type multidrug transport system fused ATPase/permease subunit
MENLSPESLINKVKDKKENQNKNNNDKIIEEEDKNKEIEKEGELDTNFEENIDLTEEEKKLRKNYLKKITKKEALYRSMILGKRALVIKFYTLIIEILQDILNIKEVKYKSDAINSITNKDLNKFIISIKYLIFALILNKITSFFERKLYNIISEKFSSKNIMLENFLFKKDIEFFDLFKTGELFNKVNEHWDYPYFNIFDICTKTFSYSLKVGYFGYYLYKDYFEMAVIYTVIIIIQSLLDPYISSLSENIDEIVDKREIRNNYINEILANIRLIKSFGTEKKELKRVNNVQSKLKEESLIIKIIREFYDSLYLIEETLSLYICGIKTITGKMDYGELLIFQKYSSELSLGVTTLKGILKSINEGLEQWIQFLKYYDIEQKIISKNNLIPKEKEGLGIKFKNVTFSYPTKKETKIINNFNLDIKPGKNIAIVGSSGSGKTTLTNLILRFYDIDNGEILINGINIKDINLSWLRNKIGIVSQEPVLTSGTIKENILYGIDNYTEKKFIEICKLSNVYSFATNTKLFPKKFDTIVGERGIKVSGGQKQRIAIARALMKDAKILIFDEATSALDSENEAIVQDAINNIIKKKNITSIIIAHRLSTVKNANLIFVMNCGKIVEFGTHDELIQKNGEYKKLIQRQLVS